MNYDEYTQKLIDESLDGFHDDECGSMDGPVGWNALFTFENEDYAGAILFCDNQGFYSCRRYTKNEDLMESWNELVEESYSNDEDEFIWENDLLS